MTPQVVLEVRDVVVQLVDDDRCILDGVSLTIRAGDRIAIVGPNGSGKSTLARVLAQLISPTSGSLHGRGERTQPRVGLVLQDPAAQSVAPTVFDDIAFGPEIAGAQTDRITQTVVTLAAACDLTPIASREPGRLSGGQQQRLALASMMACDVDVLVLDEPTALLDPHHRDEVAHVVRAHAGERAVVWITQLADEIAACNHVIVMNKGRIAWSGSTSEYVASEFIAQLGVEHPPSARIARFLASHDAWPVGAPIPTDIDSLIATLNEQVQRGG